MAMAKVLAVVVSMVLGAAAGPFSTNDESCDFTNMDLHGAVEQTLERLPKYKLFGSQTFKPAFAGFEVGAVNISGFSEFHQYGPLLPYCTRPNGTRMLQLDLIAVNGTEISIPWRHCSGNEGSINVRASFVRITTQLRVNVPESGQEVSLSHGGPTVGTRSENVVFLLRGAGEIGKQLSIGVNMVFKALIDQAWSEAIHREFGRALYEALEENGH